VTLEAINVDCAQPAGNVVVTVSPGGQTVTMIDDGTGVDQVSGDGIYTAQWTPPAKGNYSLSFPGGDAVQMEILGNYVAAPTSYNYVNIAGTNLNLSDDSVAQIISPFAIPFGGGSFTNMQVGSNGTISFTDASSPIVNKVIPGHDPKDAWTYGNFYVRAAGGGGWSKVRTIKGGIHMYDLIQRSAAPLKGGPLGGVDQAAFSKQFMYAALGTPVGAVVGVSSDFGKSWDEHPMIGTYRARTFLYGLKDMCVSTSGSKAFLVSPSGVAPLDVNLFPGVPNPGGALFAVKPASYQGTAYYLGAYAPIDHNWKAVGMFATDCHSVRHVVFPAQTPHDLLVYQGTLYLLASDAEGSGQRVRVFATSNGSSFTEVLNFLSTTFARSFEIVDGDFFFALGSEAESLHPDTGRILRIKAVLK